MLFGNPYLSSIEEVRDPIPGGLDSSPPWTTNRYQSLEGNYTLWMPPNRPQARKVVWPWLSEAEALKISDAIRSTYAPGPVALYDRATYNLLGPQQARGRGATGNFSTNVSGGSFTNAANSVQEGQLSRRVFANNITSGSRIFLANPSWVGWPLGILTAADRGVYFAWANGGASLGTGGLIGVAGLDLLQSVQETISVACTTNNGVVSGTFTNTNIRFVRPFLQVGSSSTYNNAWVGEFLLRMGTTTAPPSFFSEGKGCPGYGVESFSDVVNVWPYRTISASLVEITQGTDI